MTSKLWFALIIAASAAVPLAGLAQAPVAAPPLKSGDSWVFDLVHEQGASGYAESKLDVMVERVSDKTMVIGVKPDGSPRAYEDQMLGSDWTKSRIMADKETVIGRPFSFPMKVGDSWSIAYDDPQHHGMQVSSHKQETYKVVGWEDVTVPAGTFHALKIEANGTFNAKVFVPAMAASGAAAAPGSALSVSKATVAHMAVDDRTTYSALYYVPELKYYAKSVEEEYNAQNVRIFRNTQTLVSYKAGG